MNVNDKRNQTSVLGRQMHADRRLQFEGIANARDLGDLRTTDGKVIKRGHLYRTAHLHRASAADCQRLAGEYHLRKIIDLRTDQEVREMPDRAVPSVLHLHRPVINEGMLGITHEIRSATENRNIMIPDMPEMYRMIMRREDAMQNLGAAVREIITHDYSSGSVLWHCTEGKDRCGLTTTMVLLTLGVDEDTIMEDYLLTNEVNAPKAEVYYQKILSSGESEQAASLVRDAFLAKDEYLEAAMEVIRENYGSADAFLAKGLEITDNMREQFRDAVLSD